MSNVQIPPRALGRIAILEDQESTAVLLGRDAVAKISSLERSIHEQPHGADDPRLQEMQRLIARRDAAQRTAADVGSILSSIRGWLSKLPGHAALVDCELPLLKLPRGKSADEVSSELRGKIDALRKERRDLDRAPPPREHQEAMIHTWTSERANRVRATVLFPAGKNAAVVRFEHGPGVMSYDAVDLACYLNRAGVAEQLIADLPEESKHAVAPKAREEALEALDAKLLELEHRDEILLGMDPGIPRRVDADPRAVLGVVVSSKPRQEYLKQIDADDEVATYAVT